MFIKAEEVVIFMTEIEWLGHAGFLIKSGKYIYIDPFKLGEKKYEKADILIITHEHYDHWSNEDILKVIDKHTTIVSVVGNQSKLKRLEFADFKILNPGACVTVDDINIKAIPAYNMKKDRLKFHPKENNWVGVIIEAGGEKIYHTGDSDFIPEMKDLSGKVDVMLVPVSGIYVMDAIEASQAVLAIMPKKAIPMHYGSIVGSEKDAEKLKELLKGKVEVEIQTC